MAVDLIGRKCDWSGCVNQLPLGVGMQNDHKRGSRQRRSILSEFTCIDSRASHCERLSSETVSSEVSRKVSGYLLLDKENVRLHSPPFAGCSSFSPSHLEHHYSWLASTVFDLIFLQFLLSSLRSTLTSNVNLHEMRFSPESIHSPCNPTASTYAYSSIYILSKRSISSSNQKKSGPRFCQWRELNGC